MTTPVDEPQGDEVRLVLEFLDTVTRMLERPDFLIPLAAAQRQFRADSYQMASAAQLEDLFHDALGTFMRETTPKKTLGRRIGKELWDYSYEGLKLSHKEGVVPSLSVWWTAGQKVDTSYKPLKPTWDYDVPIVLVCVAPQSGSIAVRAEWTADESFVGSLTDRLGTRAIRKKRPPKNSALILLDHVSWDQAVLRSVWRAGTWEDLGFHEVWPEFGGTGLSRREAWLMPDSDVSALMAMARKTDARDLTLTGDYLLPGIYVLVGDGLRGMPLKANNRAHMVSDDYLLDLMREAADAKRYIPFPNWYAHFADMTPPNLYGKQRAEFERLFAPRARQVSRPDIHQPLPATLPIDLGEITAPSGA